VGVRALDNQATPAAFSSVSIIQIYHGVSQLNDIHEKPKCHILMYMIIVKKKKKKCEEVSLRFCFQKELTST
jgi:hypothetical protein